MLGWLLADAGLAAGLRPVMGEAIPPPQDDVNCSVAAGHLAR